jgi:ribonuclease D
MNITLYQGDIPASLDLGPLVAIDTETTGLDPLKDRLCLVQLSAGDGQAHLVKFTDENYAAPHLEKLLLDSRITKLFHFARADMAFIRQYLGVMTTPVYCTKIASRLTRTNAKTHGLKDICQEILNITLDKQQTLSDWSAAELTPEQLKYAADDVLYLHRLKTEMDKVLAKEGRANLAKACFDFLPQRTEMDLSGLKNQDIFAY